MPRYLLRPDSDVKAEWVEDPVGTAWSVLDEAVTQPTAPTTGSDRITTNVNAKTSSQGVTTFTLGTNEIVTSVRAWAYGKAVDASNRIALSVYDGLNSAFLCTEYHAANSFTWWGAGYMGNLTQAQLDALEVRLGSNSTGSTLEVNASYIEVTTAVLTGQAAILYNAFKTLGYTDVGFLGIPETSGTVIYDHSGHGRHGDLTGNATQSGTPLITGGQGKVSQVQDGATISGFRARDYKPFTSGSARSMVGVIKKNYAAPLVHGAPTTFAGSGLGGGIPYGSHPTWEFINNQDIRFYANVNTAPGDFADHDLPNNDDRTALIDFEFDDTTSISTATVNGVLRATRGPKGYGSVSDPLFGPYTGPNMHFNTVNDPGYLQFGYRGDGLHFEVFDGQWEMFAVIERTLTSTERIALAEAAALFTSPVVARDRPPVRLHAVVEPPSGRKKRWATDEPSPENVPSGLSFSTTIPGGFEQGNLTLPRKSKVSYSDVEPLSNLRIQGAGGQLAWEGRIEGAPRSSGSDKSISVSAVGWQAALEDDQTAVMPYVDRDLSHWQDQTAQRRVDLYALAAGVFYNVMSGFSVESDSTSPTIRLNLDSRASVGAISEAWYDSKTTLGSIYFTWTGRNLVAGDSGRIDGSTSNLDAGSVAGTDVITALTVPNGTGTATETSVSGKRWAHAILARAAVAINTDADRDLRLSTVAVYGNHGLTKRGTEPAAGFYASDVIGHAVQTWAPSLSRSIDQTGFVIPHIAYLDFTTAAEIVRDANRFHLNDWAVWDDKTFHYYEPGARGRTWKARVSEANLQEAGPQVDKVWNGVIVSYPDVDGTTRTVGPTGSVADSTSTDLIDSDPTNPANAAGLRRWVQIQSSTVTTLAGATEIGRRFLVQSAQVNTSGQADIVGTLQDDKGVIRPAWQVRAGDYISFIDASDTSPRKIVRTSYDADSLTCSIDLDAPPEGLDALLERLSVVLVPLGL
jgi:hypothetical protein